MNTSTILTNYFLRETSGNHQYNLKKGVGVPVELKMAPGLKVGNRVKSKSHFYFRVPTSVRYIWALGPRGMKSMERLLRYWQFSLSLFLCACAFVNTALYHSFVNNFAGTECNTYWFLFPARLDDFIVVIFMGNQEQSLI